jgi:hypothetical protein
MRFFFPYESKVSGDIALTPFLFLICNKDVRAYGVGVQWGNKAAGIAVTLAPPKGLPTFIDMSKLK